MQPRAVALLGEVARELVDQQPAVSEDQNAGGAGCIDEPGRGDGLAGRGRVLEPVAAPGAGVFRDRIGLQLVDGRDVCDRDIEAGVVLVVVPVLVAVAVAIPVPVAVRVVVLLLILLTVGTLAVGDQRGQLAGQRVHLVAAQRGAGGQPRRLAGEHAVEAEDQGEVATPGEAGLDQPALHLGEGGVQGGSARCAGGERRIGILTLM